MEKNIMDIDISIKKPPVEKNQRCTLEIVDLSTEGFGVGKIDGFTVFVENAVTGDVAEIVIVKVKKRHAFGKLLRLVTSSPLRVVPECPVVGVCGGCTMQHIAYPYQLEVKAGMVKNCLQRIGNLDVGELPATVSGSHSFHYRNKAQFPVGRLNGKAVYGFFAKRSHKLVAVDGCLLQSGASNEAAALVTEFINEYDIPVYDENSHTGLIRHIVTRSGSSGFIVMPVINGETLPHHEKLIAKLMPLREKGLTGILLNINKERTNVITGKRINTLWGKRYLTDSIGDLEFQVSPMSFYQVNPEVTKLLYDHILKEADLTGIETVIDIYCGIGTISLYLARHALHVTGIEAVAPAVFDARNNARINGIENVDFIEGLAEEVMTAQTSEMKYDPKHGIVVLDPPRGGCEPSVLQAVLSLNPKKIIYVSCDPATLARDLKLFDEGYHLQGVQAFDMFCQTMRVETVATLERD